MIRVGVKRLDPAVPLPTYAREGDAGLDLHAAHDVTLPPGGRALVGTGLAVAIPPGHAGFVLPRSGLALSRGVTILNAPGLIDAGYRGELKVLLVNHDAETTVTLRRGERVAQLVVQRVERAEPVPVDELPASERGAAGFGSTGC
ncbi:MAG: dUTP diphosphatase [Candidatus Rokuibacteriota bacterium]|nr:MAG: dUTP diphosphatase [Candidatus Rokubacteria bacterium]PYM63227.1 MAG: dUTP diphosphatase [Candidatus Rokubacteria bacterium]PYN67299.1 MAG: dUTP diphosphatase [Candidatus Rokubacteria bacterium]